MPKHTFVSAKLSANTAIFFQTVNWTVFLCNVCLGCPKTEAHFCQNAQMSFLVAFFPPVPFLYPFLYCLVPWHPGLESSVCLALQTADRTSSACSMRLERGPWACPSDGGTVLWRSQRSRAVCASYMGMFVRLFHGLTAKRKQLTLDSNCLKNERTPIYVQMMVFCVYVRV